MKIPWHLILTDKNERKKLNAMLVYFRKPFLLTITTVSMFMAFGVLLNMIIKKRWNNPELYATSIFLAGLMSLICLGTAAMQALPKYSTMIFCTSRVLICQALCFFEYSRFNGK